MAFIMAHMDDSTINSTLDYIKATARNATLFLVPSPKELLYFLPRMATRAGAFVIEEIPGAFHNVFDVAVNGHTIADATAEGARGGAEAMMAATTAAAGAGVMAAGAEAAQDEAAVWRFLQAFNVHHLGSLGGIFTYVTSKWFIGCFAVAMILNRTTIYASARRNLRLNWQGRALLRIVPILVLLSISQTLLQTMRCQTSPAYSSLRYGDVEMRSRLDFAGEGGFLHSISSSALFWESEEESCLAVDMIPTHKEPFHVPQGSLSTLWPSFGAFCFAQFVETLSCALQGTTPATEIGMSLFEHSLAFAEAEAMVSNQVGLGRSSKKTVAAASAAASANDDGADPVLLKKSYILTRFNVPPEVLLVALLSCLNHLSSQLLGLLGLQAKYRLLNTGIWGVAFMASFFWGIFTSSRDNNINPGILRFPTVCVVGFIPHTLILVGLLVCGCIYSLALFISVLFPPDNFPRQAGWWERLRRAHGNMQANIPLAGLSINMREDFYTSLLRTGFTALTAASEAVFLNEGRRINVGYWTWLEEERMQDFAKSKRRPQNGIIKTETTVESIATGVALSNTESVSKVDSQAKAMRGGYSRERSTEALKGKSLRAMRRNDGVGAHQRGTRYIFAFGFLSGIFWLLTGWLALICLKSLEVIGVQRRPAWLSSLLEDSVSGKSMRSHPQSSRQLQLDFWMLSEDGSLALPKTMDVDVEAETRRRLQLVERTWGSDQEEKLDSTLYSWFASGGWWGERDDSGDYEHQADDDTLSVVSLSTAATDTEWTTDNSGQATPTQVDFPMRRGRATAPTEDLPFDPAHLARLLNPQDSETRDEARMLAAHLVSDRPLTRNRYQAYGGSGKSQVLLSSRFRPPGFKPVSPEGKLTPDEEAEILEYLMIKYRDRGRSTATESSSDWMEGADGLGSGGPQCVVCQSSPRTILAWPCRCLSLCEECRVSLAMNNFGSCVCCRQEVVAFSRLFVP